MRRSHSSSRNNFALTRRRSTRLAESGRRTRSRDEELLREYVRKVLHEPRLDEAALNVVLDIVGLIPGLGEFADAANAISYAKQGEYLFAGLSIISMVPEIGDAIGKGGKLAVWVTKNFPKGAKAAAKYSPDVVKGIANAQKFIKSNKGTINKIFSSLESNEKFEQIQEYIPQIKESLETFLGLEPETESGQSAEETKTETV